jgi:hypothetical protein
MFLLNYICRYIIQNVHKLPIYFVITKILCRLIQVRYGFKLSSDFAVAFELTVLPHVCVYSV